MNILPSNLKDASGYRSPFINNLNKHVTSNRIIGGDVTPSVDVNGTTLHLKPAEARQTRWQLFAGLSPSNRNVIAVGDGSLYIDNTLIKLKNGVNGKYVKQGLLPRGSGWYFDSLPTTASSWSSCEVAIYKYSSASGMISYYLLWIFDGVIPTSEIEDYAEGESLDRVAKIGTFDKQGKIEQYITSDIYISSVMSEPETLKPWDVVQQNGSLYVASPQWTLNAPYSNFPAGATPPIPEYAQGFENTVDPSFAIDIDGVPCYLVADATCTIEPSSTIWTKYTRVYACMTPSGTSWGVGLSISDNYFTESPCCILIARINRDSNGNVTSIEQVRNGAIKSVWLETDKYYVEATSSGVVRYSEAPTGLDEGTEMQMLSFWKMQTLMNDVVLSEKENLNYSNESSFTYPQTALSYGGYIWRFNLHYNSAAQALIVDNVTTPVLNVETSQFAKIVASPFVERIAVTYPTSPLKQGYVASVGGTINVLAVEVPSTSETELFKTESINVTEDGGVIEAD